MSYCIMRMAKIKSRVSLLRAAQHNTRERQPPNADQSRTAENWLSGGSVETVMGRYSDMLPQKIRKNAVHAVELVFTASPDFSASQKEWADYLSACGTWAENLFGKSNVLHVAHHRDEATPHAHILVMPLKDGGLNAKHFIGGSRDRMTELQNDFYERVGKSFSLSRGVPRAETKAMHTTPRDVARKAALVAEREKNIAGREIKISEVGEEFKGLMGMKPAEARELKKLAANWDKATPADLRVIAKDIEQSGAATVGEYRELREAQKQKERRQQKTFSRR